MVNEITLGAFAGVLLDADKGRMNLKRVGEYNHDELFKLSFARENMRKLSRGEVKLNPNNYTLEQYNKQVGPTEDIIHGILYQLDKETDDQVVVFSTKEGSLRFTGFGLTLENECDTLVFNVAELTDELNFMLDVMNMFKGELK